MKRIFNGWKMVGAATGLQFLQAGLMGLGSAFFLAAKKPPRPGATAPSVQALPAEA